MPARTSKGGTSKPQAQQGGKASSKPKAAADDFVMTLDSDDDVGGFESEEEALLAASAPAPASPGSGDEDDAEAVAAAAIKGKKKAATAQLATREKIREDVKAKKGKGKAGASTEGLTVSRDFNFDLTGDGEEVGGGGWDLSVNGVKGAGIVGKLTVDDIIERKRQKRPAVQLPEPEEESEEEEAGSLGDAEDDDEEEELDLTGFVDEDEESDEDAFGAGVPKRAPAAHDDDSDDDEEDSEEEESGSEASASVESQDENSDASDSDKETEVEKARKLAYFATEPVVSAADKAAALDGVVATFASLGLSRPILRALSTLSFHTPTPIQARSIPLALAGKDIVAGAVTGSGKTAAFMIPILERLAHRPKGRDEAKTRVVVLTPTRELAVQCHAVGKALGKFMDVRFCLAVGGLSVKAQEQELRQRPEVVIATPGRLIDHIRNSASFGIDGVEILVMDEADRMLEEGFAAELNEIVQATPKGRQTMLFSATMTDDVDELVRLSLRRPVRLFVDAKRTTAAKLIQEFVRVRGAASTTANADGSLSSAPSTAGGKRTEDEARPALLLSLCTRTFRHEVIIFVRSKKLAHQLRIVFGLVGLSAAELHGDLTQEQRLLALQQFRDGKVDFLIATDLASRGLDIKGVQTVINYDMPGQFEQYLHRVGRTARAGRNGRSVTLVGEADRKMLKTALKRSPAAQVKHRLIPPEVVNAMAAQLDALKPDVEEVMSEEREEKALRQAEMELTKGTNMVEHHDEIFARPRRDWFATEAQKLDAKKISAAEYAAKVDPKEASKKRKADEPKRDKFAGLSRRQKRSKMLREEIAAENIQGTLDASIRSAKKEARPRAIGEPEPKKRSAKGDKKPKKKRSSTATKARGFSKDLGERGGGGGASKAPAKRSKGPPGGKPGKGGASKGGKSGGKGRR